MTTFSFGRIVDNRLINFNNDNESRKFESIHQANYKLQSHQTNNDNVLSDGDSKHRRKQGVNNIPKKVMFEGVGVESLLPLKLF